MKQKDVKVLVVDDEVAFASTLAQRLKMRGFSAATANDGEEALLRLNEDLPDVVVLDLRMPGMHGMDVLKEIKKGYPHIQVIILTGHGNDGDAEEARRLGGFDFLNKPTDIDHLELRIRRAFQDRLASTI